MLRILIVGGGYAGFYAARGLERRLRRTHVRLTVVDTRPYMTYQPFLPEVTSGAIEARHAAVSLRRHLRRTEVISGKVTSITHADKRVTVQPRDGAAFDVDYDVIVVTAGAVTRTLPIPGVAERAFGLKHVEEAVAIRDRLMVAFDRASSLPAGPTRDRLLTVTFVGGGFTGVEGFGEALSLAEELLPRYPRIRAREVRFHLVEAQERLMPEVSPESARWVLETLSRRGAHIHLDTRVTSAIDGHVVLSNGLEFDCELLVWAAGNSVNPLISRHTDLPVDGRGFLRARTDLRVGTDDTPVLDAWTAGDDAAVPDLESPAPATTRTAPTGQHAVRQGRHVAVNVARAIRGQRPKPYRHHHLGVVATLGRGHGVFESGPVVLRGRLAWLIHRGYHLMAIPTTERKVRVLADWAFSAVSGRDLVSLESVQTPRAAFVEADAASRLG
jgi:NADH dehydrogenase